MSNGTSVDLSAAALEGIGGTFLGALQSWGQSSGITSILGSTDLGRAGLGLAGGAASLKTSKELLKLVTGNKAKIFDMTKMLADKGVDMGVKAIDIMYKFGKFGDDYYGTIQETFGGIQNINKITNQTSQQQVDALETITGVYFNRASKFKNEIDSLTVTTADGMNRKVNALTAYFGDVEDVVQNYRSVFNDLRYTQTLRINEMSRTQKSMLGTFSKGFGVSNREISSVLDRTIALTGKASTDIFNRISNYSKAVSDQTGIDFKNISQSVIALITDVDKFGNIHEDAAARIAGALGQIGLSYSGFSSMVGKFQGFDSAAGSLGNLTTVFGVHFDAMEMMMLANEDQEEFLYRMRDAFLATGRSIDDMTLAEKKLAGQELGMGVKDFENFMRGEREISDLTAATAEASQLTMAQGFETMTQQMRLITRDSKEAAKFMRDKFFNEVTRDAQITSNRLALLFHGVLKATPSAVDEIRAKFQTGLSSLLQTDAGSQQMFEDEFIGGMQLRMQSFAGSPVYKKIIDDYMSKEATLTYVELEKILLENYEQLEPGELAGLNQQFLIAQGNVFKQTQQLVDKNKNNQTNLYMSLREQQESTQATSLTTESTGLGTKSYEASVVLKTEQEKAALTASINKKIQAANDGSGFADIKDELKLLVAGLNGYKGGSTDPLTINFETTGPEAVKFRQIMNELLKGITVKQTPPAQ